MFLNDISSISAHPADLPPSTGLHHGEQTGCEGRSHRPERNSSRGGHGCAWSSGSSQQVGKLVFPPLPLSSQMSSVSQAAAGVCGHQVCDQHHQRVQERPGGASAASRLQRPGRSSTTNQLKPRRQRRLQNLLAWSISTP